ncbi:MAG TPA: outer membrane beta-barrel protein [Pseudolabrys sp.]|nr:outer membrane beta-barrel protein [Pseudolabrys sp.]
MTCTIRISRAALAALTLVLAVPAGASAQDFLRGSLFNSAGTRWDGINLGVQLGLSNMHADFGNSTSALVAFALRNTTVENEFSPSSWTTLPSTTTNGRQYGAFLGYNVQWDQLVVGFDLAYNRTSSLEASASDSIARQVVTSDNVNNVVTITAQSSVTLIDYATMRARAGYAFGQFLPYAVVGAAVGRFDYANTATVHDVGTPLAGSSVSAFNTLDTESDSKNNAVVGGALVGLGLDVAVLPHVFVRAEWEYIAFAPVGGIRTTLNTGRVGIGARF